MSFTIDKQTLDDLKIFGKRGDDSIYSIFNSTHTRGGAEQLEHMFRYPLSDLDAINHRSSIIQHFKSLGDQLIFPFRAALFDEAEAYLADNDTRSRLLSEDDTLDRKLKNYLGGDSHFQNIQKGVLALIELLNELQNFMVAMQAAANKTPYYKELQEIEAMLKEEAIAGVIALKEKKKLGYQETSRLDGILRFTYREAIQKLLYNIYILDVYISVAKVAAVKNYAFPKALSGETNVVKLEDVYHPQLSKPVSNSITINAENHIVFLTGANMAGKSTFMKTLGVALFLAHMGFPVAAKNMEFSVKDGIITTINLPDNLNMGYSHFYAEVLRVKQVAEELRQGKNLFVMFDEMFRGTNVKDAYDATLALCEAFDTKEKCIFVISTHITEAGELLRKQHHKIGFKYLPTVMKGNVPQYTYQLQTGISEDRHGMIIINNEGILDILKKGQFTEADKLVETASL